MSATIQSLERHCTQVLSLFGFQSLSLASCSIPLYAYACLCGLLVTMNVAPMVEGSSILGPAVVGLVLVLGIVQSVVLLTVKPWSTSPAGARGDRSATVTSSCLGSPQTLLFTRLASLVIAIVVAVRQIGHTGTIHFKFYTVWSFYLLIAYFACAAVSSLQRVRAKHPAQRAERMLTGLEYATVAAYHVMLTTIWIVDSITWTVLWPMIKDTTSGAELERLTGLFFCFTSYMQHGGNAVLVLVEFALNDIRIHPYLFGWVGLWTATFSAWAITWRLISGKFLYPFLDWTKPWAPVAYIGLFLGHWLFFGCVLGMQRIKAACLRGNAKEVKHLKDQ